MSDVIFFLQPLSMKETWTWVRQAYGDELGLSSDDEYYEYLAAVLNEKTVPVNPRLSADSLSEVSNQSIVLTFKRLTRTPVGCLPLLS